MAPKFIDTVFRRIEFVLLKRGQILAIFVSQSGLLQNKILEIDEESISQDDLDKFSRYLNEILFGLTLREVRHKILEEMKKERNIYNKLLSRALWRRDLQRFAMWLISLGLSNGRGIS